MRLFLEGLGAGLEVDHVAAVLLPMKDVIDGGALPLAVVGLGLLAAAPDALGGPVAQVGTCKNGEELHSTQRILKRRYLQKNHRSLIQKSKTDPFLLSFLHPAHLPLPFSIKKAAFLLIFFFSWNIIINRLEIANRRRLP